MTHAIRADRCTIGAGKAVDDPAFRVQGLGGEQATAGVRIDFEGVPDEHQRLGGRDPLPVAGSERDETIETQRCQTDSTAGVSPRKANILRRPLAEQLWQTLPEASSFLSQRRNYLYLVPLQSGPDLGFQFAIIQRTLAKVVARHAY